MHPTNPDEQEGRWGTPGRKGDGEVGIPTCAPHPYRATMEIPNAGRGVGGGPATHLHPVGRRMPCGLGLGGMGPTGRRLALITWDRG